MPVEHINETDTLNQGRLKINAVLDQSNESSKKVDDYEITLSQGIEDAKEIASEAGEEAINVATAAGQQANVTANEAKGIASNANTKSDNAVATANQNKQEFDQLRNDFDDLVAEAGDSNPEIVQARTDTLGVKQTTLSNRLTVDFADRLTNADAINILSGETVVKKMMDYSGKTAGNTATNPHIHYSDYTSNTLKKPSASWNEISQSDYNKLASRDDSGVSTGSTAAGIIPQQRDKFSVIETVKALAPQLFTEMDDEEAVQFVIDNFVSFQTTVRAKASSPNNKNFKTAIHMPSTDSYNTLIQQEAGEYTDITVQVNDSQYINSDGAINLIYYSDSSNGVTPASIDMDYSGTTVSVTINGQEVLINSGFAETEKTASREALANHVDDLANPHQVTATQTGAYSKVQADEKFATLLDSMYYRGSLSGQVDFNDVTELGIYYVANLANFSNKPNIGGSWGYLEVMGYSTQVPIVQRFTDTIGNIFVRGYAGATPVWSDWATVKYDSGWTNLSLSSGFRALGGFVVQVRRVNDKVSIRGVLDGAIGIKLGAFANLPSWATPSQRSGYNVALWSTVNENAIVYARETGVLEMVSISNTSKNVWLNQIEFYVN